MTSRQRSHAARVARQDARRSRRAANRATRRARRIDHTVDITDLLLDTREYFNAVNNGEIPFDFIDYKNKMAVLLREAGRIYPNVPLDEIEAKMTGWNYRRRGARSDYPGPRYTFRNNNLTEAGKLYNDMKKSPLYISGYNLANRIPDGFHVSHSPSISRSRSVSPVMRGGRTPRKTRIRRNKRKNKNRNYSPYGSPVR